MDLHFGQEVVGATGITDNTAAVTAASNDKNVIDGIQLNLPTAHPRFSS